MKHAVIIDDELYPQFKNDIGGVTVIVADKNGGQSELTSFPLARPMIVTENGNAAYLSPGHIECFAKFEREQAIKRTIDDMILNLNTHFTDAGILNSGGIRNGKYPKQVGKTVGRRNEETAGSTVHISSYDSEKS